MLIACANVAVLFTVRATHRQQEIAVRKALGAIRRAIARALAAEAVVLGATATAIGLALAQAIDHGDGAAAGTASRPIGARRRGALRIDGATLATALLTGLLVIAVCCAAQIVDVAPGAADAAL